MHKSAIKRRNLAAWNDSGLGGLDARIIRMWGVDSSGEDHSYRQGDWEETLIVRTNSGAGEFFLADGSCVAAPAGSVLVLDGPAVRGHRCAGERWDYWFFHAAVSDLPIERGRSLSVPRDEEEDAAFLSVLGNLRRATGERIRLANAIFAQRLLVWAAYLAEGLDTDPVRRAVDRVRGLMHDRLQIPWRVEDMAREAGLPVREFRRRFEAAAGEAPKACYDRLRLEHARELLRFRGRSVARVAAELGFSSPFHLSRAFRARFGYPPSAAAEKAAAPEAPAKAVPRLAPGDRSDYD